MYWLKRNKNFLYLLVIFFAVLTVAFPLFHDGFFVTDDGEWMIIRLSAFYQAFADGQFPVRFLGRLNHEYGYPVPTFLYPGFTYVGSILHLFKIGVVDTVKIIIGLSIVSSAVFTFFWLRKFFTKKAALWGALFIIYSPYYLFDIYSRGSVGEVLALAIAPFVLWQIQRRSMFWSSIGIGFMILSHNSLAALFMVFLIIYMLTDILTAKKKAPLAYIYAMSVVLGLGLAAFFWVPIIFELPLTKFSETGISNPFEYFADFKLIGYANILSLLTALFLLITKKVSIKNNRLSGLFLAFNFVSIILASQYSGFLWSIIPASFIQFPFRFLSLAIVTGAFLAAFVFSNLKDTWRLALVVVVAGLFMHSIYSQASQIRYFDKGEGFYITNSATTTVHDEYMPIWVREKPHTRFERKVEIIGEGEISSLVYNNKSIEVDVDLISDSILQVNTVYWPGWEAFVDDAQSEISYNNPRGIMQFELSRGSHQLDLKFNETNYRLIADVFSVLSLAVLILISRKNVLWKK